MVRGAPCELARVTNAKRRMLAEARREGRGDLRCIASEWRAEYKKARPRAFREQRGRCHLTEGVRPAGREAERRSSANRQARARARQ